MRKSILEKDLVPGQRVYTTKGVRGTLLEFVSRNKKSIFFTDLSVGEYYTSEEGLVEFTSNMHNWYLPNEDEL